MLKNFIHTFHSILTYLFVPDEPTSTDNQDNEIKLCDMPQNDTNLFCNYPGIMIMAGSAALTCYVFICLAYACRTNNNENHDIFHGDNEDPSITDSDVARIEAPEGDYSNILGL